MLSRFEKWVRPLTKGINMAGTIGLFFMMLVVTADVFLRDVFNQPIKGSIEIAELFQVLVVFFGLAYCEAQRGHVRVEILISYVGRRTRLALDSVTWLFRQGCLCLSRFLNFYTP